MLQLRNLLFNNPRMEEILRNAQGSDEDGWAEWLRVMKAAASLGDRLAADFAYLRERFDTFAELVSVVRLLRRSPSIRQRARLDHAVSLSHRAGGTL